MILLEFIDTNCFFNINLVYDLILILNINNAKSGWKQQKKWKMGLKLNQFDSYPLSALNTNIN